MEEWRAWVSVPAIEEAAEEAEKQRIYAKKEDVVVDSDSPSNADDVVQDSEC